MNSSELMAELSNHYGTEGYQFNPLYSWLKYTDGVHAFINNAGGGAYWFLDIIGTELKTLSAIEGFLAIDLVSTGNKAAIKVTDGNDRIVYRKDILYTDCPAGCWSFFLTDNVMMLSREY